MGDEKKRYGHAGGGMAGEQGCDGTQANDGTKGSDGTQGSHGTPDSDDTPGNILEIHDLAAGYQKIPLIKGIDLTVKGGEILTLIGPNGAGKSTILKTIAGQLRALGGAVFWSGQDMAGMRRGQIARTLSMVLSGQPRLELMTCREVVATGRYPYTGRLGILSKQDWDKVDQSLLMVHANEVAERDFMQLSDGQRQRVMLARALCQEPKVLILDEPTSYLDVRYKLEILTTIREIARQGRLAVLMSLHELDLAYKVSDYIACVSGGQALRVGAPEEIMRPGVIERLYGMEEGSFDVTSQMPQFPAAHGKPQTFVIGGGGSAANVYYRLQRQGIPFAAGILPANDVECPIVKALACETLIAPAYEPPDQAMMKRAKDRIDQCRNVLCTLTEFGTYNAYNRKLWEYAKESGKVH